MELILIFGVVGLAAAGVGYSLYRMAAGKSGCTCTRCSRQSTGCQSIRKEIK